LFGAASAFRKGLGLDQCWQSTGTPAGHAAGSTWLDRGRRPANRTRLPSGERLEPSADSALLQLKDSFEVLIKFTATVLMRGLIEAGGGDADWAPVSHSLIVLSSLPEIMPVPSGEKATDSTVEVCPSGKNSSLFFPGNREIFQEKQGVD